MTEPVEGEETPSQHRGLMPPWKPGQSGNPAGRPRGARSKLTEAFLSALQEDFDAHGREAIAAGREKDPNAYARTIAALLPKQVEGSEEGEAIRHEFSWKSAES